MKQLLAKIFIATSMTLASLIPVGWSLSTGAMVPQVAMAADPGCVDLSVSVSKDGSKTICPNGSNSVIITYVVLILQFLGAAVGGVIVLMLIIAGVQYIVAAGDPSGIKAAKSRITNAITALVLFLFMYAILNFLIPGGIFT